MQLKYSNYVAFSHFHGKAVNNSGLVFQKKIPATTFEHYDTLHLHSNVPPSSISRFCTEKGAPVL